MPEFIAVRGKPTGLFLRLLDIGVTTAPTPVNATVAAAGAAIDAVSIPVAALSAAIPKDTILTFSRAAGSPSSLKVVVTANAAAAAVSIAIEMFDGIKGQGLTHALAEDDEAVWDGLYTDVGANDSSYSNNAQSQDLQAIVYGGAGTVPVSQPDVQSIAPQIARQGFFNPEGQLTQDILQYADTNRQWWIKQVVPDTAGAPYLTREGLAKITGLSQPLPAAGLLELTFNIQFVQQPTIEFAV